MEARAAREIGICIIMNRSGLGFTLVAVYMTCCKLCLCYRHDCLLLHIDASIVTDPRYSIPFAPS